ncbi:MAG: cobyrinate a,c-diamide synthase [Proteobacteria bacterium]|nr:cobyrinate a,c-diamide synthase [Pseudomonadota bacterium]MBU1639143.1 cobyrinate a,c-diamide synthase [Pseudomonadota bacterium]
MPSSFLLAGTHSGCGKTTISLGIMAALRQMGYEVQPFKCGPDFIDPTLHGVVCDKISRNLDLRMCGPDFVRQVFAGHPAQVRVVEGVMGLFDGGEASAASLAKALDIPVILVVDVRSAAESVAAVVKGFSELDPEVRLLGVIFNRIGSPRHLELVQGAVEKYCTVPVLGYLPRDVEFSIPERHLGLHMGEEGALSAETISRLAETILHYVDVGGLLAASTDGADQVIASVMPPTPVPGPKKRLAVARDEAFCFYYQDNFDLLAQAGVELVFFSPLHDRDLPADIKAVYLGGGYPELFGAMLAANTTMRTALKKWSEQGGIMYAECGGFMYLSQGIVNHDGGYHEMVGVFPVQARMSKGLRSLGYREATLVNDSLWGGRGDVVRGHEFHYSEIDAMPVAISRVYQLQDGRAEGYQLRNTLGGYLHLHFGGTPGAVAWFAGKLGEDNQK